MKTSLAPIASAGIGCRSPGASGPEAFWRLLVEGVDAIRVAVHLACQSLWTREATLAQAGGANAMFQPEFTLAESKAGMLSPDGRCKTFDARANGYVRGEGAGVVVLKPLAAALADGDDIYALIRGTAINQDGRTSGITVPSDEAQQALACEAFQRAGLSPSAVQYIEAHGTGTPVGDPIEARALGDVFGPGRPDGERCLVDSVKTNVGHIEAAAGVAGLLKAAPCLKHRQVPPRLHLKTPNPQIDFDALRLRVPVTLEPWPKAPGPALAAVNSFGFGGANARAGLSEAPAAATPLESPAVLESPTPALVALSARSDELLRANFPVRPPPLLQPLVKHVAATTPAEGTRGPQAQESLRVRLAKLEGMAARKQLLEDFLCVTIARSLRLAPEQRNRQQSFQGFGLDSVIAVELRLHITSEPGVSPSIVELLQDLSVASLTERLLPRIQLTTSEENLDDLAAQLETLTTRSGMRCSSHSIQLGCIHTGQLNFGRK